MQQPMPYAPSTVGFGGPQSSSSSFLPRVAGNAGDPYSQNSMVADYRYSPKSGGKAVDLPHLASTVCGPVVRGGAQDLSSPGPQQESAGMQNPVKLLPAAVRRSLGFAEENGLRDMERSILDSALQDNGHLRASAASFSKARCTSLPALHTEQHMQQSHDIQQLKELQHMQQLLQQQSEACGAAAQALQKQVSDKSEFEWLQTPFQRELVNSQSASLSNPSDDGQFRPPVPPEHITTSQPAARVNCPAQPLRIERKLGSASSGCGGTTHFEMGQAPAMGRAMSVRF